MLRSLLVAATSVLVLAACAPIKAMDASADSSESAVPTDNASDAWEYAQKAAQEFSVEDAIADPLRPATEIERDPLRKPADMLAFAQIEPGDVIADIRPGAGYFTRLFARVVGDEGKVYAFVPNRTMARENAPADLLVAAYPNVTRVNGDLDTLAFDQPLDVVFMSQEYHDFHIPGFGVDVARMNAAILAALKPGGLYVVIDHSGRAGTTNTEVQTLHRIEGEFLKAEVVAAGFVFDGETAVLANPADDRTVNVFEPVIRGKTDQFVYRFRKPS